MKARTLLQQSQIGGVGAQKTICATAQIGDVEKEEQEWKKRGPGPF